jgi:hypothetical protein
VDLADWLTGKKKFYPDPASASTSTIHDSLSEQKVFAENIDFFRASQAAKTKEEKEAVRKKYIESFDTKVFYHASPETEIKEFDPTMPYGMGLFPDESGAPEFASRGATFFSERMPSQKAVLYSDGGIGVGGGSTQVPAQVVYPVKIRTKNLFDYSDPDQMKKLLRKINELHPSLFVDMYKPDNKLHRDGLIGGDWDQYELPIVQKALKDLGYRGYRTNEEGTVALFHPDKGDVRSVFAKFDPSAATHSTILKAVPPAAIATGALSQLVDEEEIEF